MAETASIIDLELPSGDRVTVPRRRFGRPGSGPRMAVVAGIRGDTPEGMRVAFEVGRILEEREDVLQGCVDVYPCVNPLAAHRGSRRWPFFEVDLNRRFPGRADGHAPDCVAAALVADVRGADLVVELRGAHPAFRECPQAHIRPRDEEAAERAMLANVSVVWQRRPGPAAASTFAHQFPGTIVLEGGTGNRLTAGVGKDLADGVLNLAASMGILPEDALPFHWAGLSRPVRVSDAEVARLRANSSGLFLPEVDVWAPLGEGQRIGTIVDPLHGVVKEEVRATFAGRLLAVREHPVVFPGSKVARVVAVETT